VRMLRPQLEATDDWHTISGLAERVLIVGTSAARQRQSLRCRGRLTDVVDLLIDETAGRRSEIVAPKPLSGHAVPD
jgi:carboxylate-amine ligase